MINEVKKLSLPRGKYAVIMGASLCAHDVRDAGDVDIIIDKCATKCLLKKGFMLENLVSNGVPCQRFSKGNIEIFDYFLNVGTFDKRSTVFKELDIISGIPFINLKNMMMIKNKFGRDKDMKDILLIKAHLTR